MSLLTFADKVEPSLWDRHEEILSGMDLQGEYQRKNLRTVLAALDVLKRAAPECSLDDDVVSDAVMCTALRVGFHGRWEKLSDSPYTICDIGHNEHGLKYNFAQLSRMVASGKFSKLILVYGSVADKDVDSVLHLMPENAVYIFTQADSKRALPAEKIREKYMSFCLQTGRPTDNIHAVPSVKDAVTLAVRLSDPTSLIYIGGSTYVVSEAIPLI